MFSCSCDTMVAMGDITDDGSIIFGKNSDRQSNEPLAIRYVPSSINLANSQIKTTYIQIDQVEKTFSCILFCPTNVFGAEMGFNCHGLVVGNEALFTKIKSNCLGLTGMDLVRLVLERCSTSKEGKDTIINLLNQYGQGGNCGFTSKMFYQNSFLLVDSTEGWIIETVGKDYAAKKIQNGIHSISNKISFGGIETFDEYSKNLIDQAILNGWCQSIEDFDFEKCYSGISFYPKEFYNGFIKTYFSSSQIRQLKSKDLINKSKGFSEIDMFNVLRDHKNSNLNPSNGLTNIDICMHASFGPIKFNQTTGSLVSVIPKSFNQIPRHYATCTSCTCLSIFKPIWLDSTILPPTFILSDQINSSSIYSSKNIWWKGEIINRNIIKYYQKLIQQIQIERNLLENQFVLNSKKLSLKNISQDQRNHFTCLAFHKADQLTCQWFSRACSLSFQIPSELSLCQQLIWERWRQSAQIPIQLLKYPKIQINKIIILFISFLFFIFYFQNNNQFYFIIIIIIIYFVLIKLIFNKTKEEQTNISLPKLHFYN